MAGGGGGVGGGVGRLKEGCGGGGGAGVGGVGAVERRLEGRIPRVWWEQRWWCVTGDRDLLALTCRLKRPQQTSVTQVNEQEWKKDEGQTWRLCSSFP